MSESDLNNLEICIICNDTDLEDNHLFKKPNVITIFYL